MYKRVKCTEGGGVTARTFTLRVFHILNADGNEMLLSVMADMLGIMELRQGFELTDEYMSRFIRAHGVQSVGIVTNQPLENFLQAIGNRVDALGLSLIHVKLTTHELHFECCNRHMIANALSDPFSTHDRLYSSNEVEIVLNLN